MALTGSTLQYVPTISLPVVATPSDSMSSSKHPCFFGLSCLFVHTYTDYYVGRYAVGPLWVAAWFAGWFAGWFAEPLFSPRMQLMLLFARFWMPCVCLPCLCSLPWPHGKKVNRVSHDLYRRRVPVVYLDACILMLDIVADPADCFPGRARMCRPGCAAMRS